MLEEYADRIQHAKEKQFGMLDRFHVGDIVYPCWLTNFVVYGTVIDVDTVARKVICDFNGVMRQFVPDDLMIVNPAIASLHKAGKKASVDVEYSKHADTHLSEDTDNGIKAVCKECGGEVAVSYDEKKATSDFVCTKCGKRIPESKLSKKTKKAMREAAIRIQNKENNMRDDAFLRKAASELMIAAKMCMAFDDDGTQGAPAEAAPVVSSDKAAELSKRLDDLYDQFDAALSDRVKEYNAAAARYKLAEQQMKDAISEFNKETGWNKQMTACEQEIAAFEKAGGLISEIKTKFDLSSSVSLQPSYKEWLKWVLETLGADLFKHYLDRLDTFKKNTIKLSNNCKLADQQLKEWSDEAKSLYGDAGLKLPKASVTAAGLTDTLKSVGQNVADFTKRIFNSLKNSVLDLINSFTSSADSMEADTDVLKQINDSWKQGA